MAGYILNQPISPRGDMSSYSESFAHEDYFMQQARNNGKEIGAADPSAAVGNFLKFAVNLVSANFLSIVPGLLHEIIFVRK